MNSDELSASDQEASESGRDDNLTDSANLRKRLYSLAKTLLSDIRKISNDLKNNSTPFQYTLLTCIQNGTESNPQAFVPILHGEPHVAEASKSNQIEAEISVYFTKWIIARLLSLLSSVEVTPIHSSCIDTLRIILQLARRKNVTVFRQLAFPLIEILNDLIEFNINEASACGNNVYIVTHYSMPRNILDEFEQNQNRDELTGPAIYSTDVSDTLQMNIMLLLQQLALDITHHLPDKMCILWNTVCLELEHGNFHNKKIALDVTKVLTNISGLPFSNDCVSYLLSCLEALSKLIFSGEINMFSHSGLEDSFAVCWLTVLDCLSDQSNSFLIDYPLVYHMIEEILICLMKYSTSSISSRNFKEAMVSGLVKLLQFAGSDAEVILNPLLEQTVHTLLNCFDKMEGKNIYVPLFQHSILQQLNAVFEECGKSCPKQEKSENTANEQVHIGNNKASHVGNTSFNSPSIDEFVEKSVLWNSVKEKYAQLIQKVNSGIKFNDPSYLEKVISGVSGCVDILMQVVSEIMSSEKVEPVSSVPLLCLSDLWEVILSIINSPYDLTAELLRHFIHISDCILQCQDKSLKENDYVSICMVLSLPWLAEMITDTHDLQFKMLSPELQTYWSKLSLSSLQIETISGLSLLPSFVAPVWRLNIIFLCLRKSDNHLTSAMVASIPNCLVNIEKDCHLEICHSINFTGTFPGIAFAENIGKLACALAPSVQKKHANFKKKSSHGYTNWICEVCDISSEEMSAFADNSVMVWLQESVIWCVCHPEDGVRFAAVSNFPSVFAHMQINFNLLKTVLKLLVDENVNVRISFSETIKYLLIYHKNSFSSDSSYPEILVTELKTAIVTANATSDFDLLQTILLTIGQVGQVTEDDLLLICVVSLMESLKSAEPLICSIAHDQLNLLAKVRDISMIDLYKKFKHVLGKFIMDALLDSQADDSTLLKMLDYMVKTFGFNDATSFLSNTLRHNLPYLVYRASPAAAKLIKLFAKQMDLPVRQIYVNNFKYIFSYLVCKCSKVELENSLLFSQDETDIELGSLLRYDYQRTHNELLLHMSTHYDNVINGLLILASKDNCQDSGATVQKENLATFLQPRLLGFIAFFDSRLLNMYIPLSEKKQALESLICIITLMGEQHITPIRIKVMATLRIALRFNEGDFPKTCCKAWDAFIHNVELSSLGTLLNQIMATLLPLLKLDPQGVSGIFKFLIVENQDQLKNYFYDLYFIPDLPELSIVNSVLKDYIENPSNESDFHALLNHSLKGVAHENIEVRLHALVKVKQLLQIHHNTLHEHLMGREVVDPLISRLLSLVMMSCQETDKRVQCVLAEVFGEVGAIDPGRLETVSTGSKRNIHFHSSISDENFAFDLIQKLVHSFLAAEDSRTQDCSSYAIQELLQIYKCHGTAESPHPQSSLWKRFSHDVQEILFPLLHSKYIPGHSRANVNIQKPIYGSTLGKSFVDWVTNWISDLVAKVKSQMASQVFSSCLMIAKYDISCALFLLPYFVLYVIREGADEGREELYLEFISVLKHCEQLHSQKSNQFNECHLSTQTVFSVLDYLKRWVQHQESTSSGKGNKSSEAPVMFMVVNDFIARIPKILLAKASFQCGAFARALMYLELYIRANKDKLQSMLSFLQKIYFSLDEPDGVAGVAAIRRYEATMEEQIVEYEATGQMQEAFACYEKALKFHPEVVSYHLGHLNCLMRLDQYHTALTYATGLLERKTNWKSDILPYQVEAAWKLSDWGNLKSFLTLDENADNWNIGIGQLLLAAKEDDGAAFWNQLKCVRSKQMGPLSAASMEDGGYQRGYQYLMRLHMLTDLENGLQTILKSPQGEGRVPCELLQVGKVLEEWASRRQLTQSSLRHQEPILSLQRSVLMLIHAKLKEFDDDIKYGVGLCWLESAKLARKSGHWQRAFSCLLDARSYNLPQTFMEEAKWHWHKGEQQQAINTLQKGIQEHFPDAVEFKSVGSLGEIEIKQTCAKAKLMLARYSEEAAIVESGTLLQMYREVVSINSTWEDSYFYIGKYFDRILSTTDKNEKKVELAIQVIKNFGQSLQFGCKHVYHSLPRLLSLWFELGSQVADAEKNKRISASLPQMELFMSQLTSKVIPWLSDKIPAYIFLTAFPQLISRICHSHPDVVQLLQTIIAKLLVTFPQQAMWMMMSVSKSSYPARVHRCQEIFSKAKRLNPDLAKFIQDSTQFAEKLLELCNKQITEGSSFSINSTLRSLPRLLDDPNFSHIMLPLQSLMMVTLPTDVTLQSSHNPFPQTPVHIVQFEDTVEILPSLQKPKKVTIRGSDGKLYVMMCKPKDDLRKDCKLMEFNNLVNRCLKRDPESRKRQLYIRTYAVIPLNEECGIIEWVPNLSGLRYILNSIYRERGLFTTSREIRSWVVPQNASLEQKLESFRNVFLPRFPPVFADWFLRTFNDPTAWYMARLKYARTTAVISTVGYILGLGDRHGENILFDSSCGDTVHVDFNCLFNKGETFDWPERVPFRLTHNMVDALGPTKYEGVFRKACEVTMRVMRSQTDALMSVLKPFIHDPLVEWSSKKPYRSRVNSVESGEIQNEKAITHVRDIEQRLKGIIKSKNKSQMLPLSVEGQISYLIAEATDEKNLCQMYVGWAAYM